MVKLIFFFNIPSPTGHMFDSREWLIANQNICFAEILVRPVLKTEPSELD